MLKKLLTTFLFIFLIQIAKSQNEFITIWKPNVVTTTPTNPTTPYPAPQDQIWFPGIGTNYTISWEEIGYPQHNGTLTNVTTTDRILIDFGTSQNPNADDATYRVKVSNGNGTFKRIKFGENTIMPTFIFDNVQVKTSGSSDKITEIEQWGNIQWESMNNAFSQCFNVQITATDSPDLSAVEDASLMFFNAFNFKGAPSMANWNTSAIKNFQYIFGYMTVPLGFALNDIFDAPVGSWNMSSAENISYMFYKRRIFNQNLNDWNTSKVTNMQYTFAETKAFNQPLNHWDTSKAINMMFLFHFNPVFNQPLDSWDISSATSIGHMFHGCTAFNQPLNSWNTTKVTDTNTMFTEAASFNQTLQDWNLPVLSSADNMFLNSGLNCNHYSRILMGWATNPNTANGVNLQLVSPLFYSSAVDYHRSLLLSKGWNLTGDTITECSILGVSDHNHATDNSSSIYPNPATNVIYLKNLNSAKSYIITDASGRVIAKDNIIHDFITIESLIPGNYILQVVLKDKIQSFKFIKK